MARLADSASLNVSHNVQKLKHQISLTRVNTYAKCNKHNGVDQEQNSLYQQEYWQSFEYTWLIILEM